jgi:hypothetical protein
MMPNNSDTVESPNLQGAHGVIYFAAPHLSILITLCILAGIAVMGTAWAIHSANQSRMETRLLQVKVEGFENALWAAKIDPTPHLKGQPD